MTQFDTAAFSPAGAGSDAMAFGRHTIRITADQTGGRLGCFECEVPPGEGPPMHVHEKEEEFFRVLDGTFAFWCNGTRVELGAGGLLVVPRGAVHRFQNVGATVGHLMVVMTPGGFEGFFPAVAAAKATTPDEIGLIAARHNLRFVMEAAEVA